MTVTISRRRVVRRGIVGQRALAWAYVVQAERPVLAWHGNMAVTVPTGLADARSIARAAKPDRIIETWRSP